MTSNNEYFTSERIDEQIEELHQQSFQNEPGDEAQLVGLLQRHYRNSPLVEDRASLERARQRIMRQQNETGTFDRNILSINRGEIRGNAHARHTHRTRLMRVLSGLAATLIVGILIGGWITVTHMASTPTTLITQQQDMYTIHNGMVYRFDGKSGKVIWQHFVSTRKPADPNQGGDAYLQVVNHIVYAVLDFDIYALDARNGKQVWHVTNRSNKAYFWFVVDNGRIYLFSLDNTFSALNAANGTELWHNTTFTTENGYGFTVRNGNLYTQNSAANPEDQKLYTLDGATGRVRWNYPTTQGSLLDPPIVENGVVYFSLDNTLIAVKEQSGKKIWERMIPAAGALTATNLANGILYANGGLGSLLQSYPPTAINTDNMKIFALNVRTGEILWTSDPGYNLLGIPITGGLLLASRQYNGVYSIAGLDPHTGKAVWQTPLTCTLEQGPHLGLSQSTCSILWSEGIDGKLYLLESDNQPQHGRQPQGSSTFKTVYTIKTFNPSTGKLLSTHQLNIGQDGLTTVGSSNGLLYTRINVSHTENTIPVTDFIFAAYRLSDGVMAWRYAMPPFPPPTSANTSPYTSQPVLAP